MTPQLNEPRLICSSCAGTTGPWMLERDCELVCIVRAASHGKSF